MAKDDLKLNLDMPEPAPAAKPAPQKAAKGGKGDKKGPNFFQRIAKGIARVFREMWSELKKVDWPPFKKTKNNPGVWANLGTVVVVVLFFMVVITAIDIGLTALLRVLVRY